MKKQICDRWKNKNRENRKINRNICNGCKDVSWKKEEQKAERPNSDKKNV